MKDDEKQIAFEVELAEDSEGQTDVVRAEAEEDGVRKERASSSDAPEVPEAVLEDEDNADEDKRQTGWRRLFQSEDLPQLSLREILGGDFLVGDFLRRQIRFILLLMLLGIAYITNRYVAQQEIIEEENLRKELTEKKNYALTQYSELTRQSRQSMLEQRLRANGDSTLSIPKEPPFFIVKKPR